MNNKIRINVIEDNYQDILKVYGSLRQDYDLIIHYVPPKGLGPEPANTNYEMALEYLTKYGFPKQNIQRWQNHIGLSPKEIYFCDGLSGRIENIAEANNHLINRTKFFVVSDSKEIKENFRDMRFNVLDKTTASVRRAIANLTEVELRP